MTHLYRGARWHVWTAPGFRFGVGVIPQRRSQFDTRTEAMLWLGPLLVTRRIGRFR